VASGGGIGREGGGGYIYINLSKLQAGTLQTLQDDAEIMDNITARTTTRTSRTARKLSHRKPEPEPAKPQRIKSVKQFFGPVVDTTHEDEEGKDTLTHTHTHTYTTTKKNKKVKK
jgi:hypothetical protein